MSSCFFAFLLQLGKIFPLTIPVVILLLACSFDAGLAGSFPLKISGSDLSGSSLRAGFSSACEAAMNAGLIKVHADFAGDG